ncbi:hypothetical protein TRFO_15411 [Tritrichomonas foetus]|uniref:Protein kinase domain-containing protein n=1 Tax=Tritrichomonas foetus TaxID=1144522 RepID=A0A1J4KXH1_9EUKA|nr:hypothetical protein TRFO_15411 [Tritrichomonas foetus]|eukprot:OHT14253.1 hypothetical protein TRFO_15411 [Tritrichomonas foetus]
MSSFVFNTTPTIPTTNSPVSNSFGAMPSTPSHPMSNSFGISSSGWKLSSQPTLKSPEFSLPIWPNLEHRSFPSSHLNTDLIFNFSPNSFNQTDDPCRSGDKSRLKSINGEEQQKTSKKSEIKSSETIKERLQYALEKQDDFEKNIKNLNCIILSQKEELRKQSEYIKLLESKQISNSTIDKNQKKCETKIFSQKEMDEYIHHEKIGSGGSSDVIKVSTNKFYAMKVLKIDFDQIQDVNEESNTENDSYFRKIQRFLKEYEILSQIKHQYVIKTYGMCYGDEKHPPSILLEYCKTNLKKYIKQLPKSEISRVLIEICLGMSYIHQQGIIHRDLKPENILLGINFHVKISDFDVSTLSKYSTHTQGVGAFIYMAPELLNEEEHYTEKVDIYSFGIVVYFILTEGKIPKFSLKNILNGEPLTIPVTFDSFYHHIIELCLSYNPASRPSFDELINIIQMRH